MGRGFSRYRALLLPLLGILTIFIVRTLLAAVYPVPRLSEIFETLTVIGSVAVCISGCGCLKKNDWLIAIALGAGIGAGMCFATLFRPYPVFGTVHSNLGHALRRGLYALAATLGGTAVMRQGGPVQFTLTHKAWRQSGRSMVLGLLIGLPLAIVNVVALQMTEGKAISWANPFAAMLDALQPGVFEEVVYRFALLGLLWLMLRKSLPKEAGWLAGLLALLVHNFVHFDDLFLQAPLVALGLGSAMAILWGLPPTILALRKDLESVIAFHWIQDVARFLTGF